MDKEYESLVLGMKTICEQGFNKRELDELVEMIPDIDISSFVGFLHYKETEKVGRYKIHYKENVLEAIKAST